MINLIWSGRWKVEIGILISCDLVVMIGSIAVLVLYARVHKIKQGLFTRHFAKILASIALEIIFKSAANLTIAVSTIKSAAIPQIHGSSHSLFHIAPLDF
jgi:hypothetical protein